MPDILVIDFGGQYSHLISRRLRTMGVDVDLVEYNKIMDTDYLSDINYRGIILSGGPKTVGDKESPVLPEFIRNILDNRQIPVLGICYGHQLLGDYLGGKLEHGSNREYGKTRLTIMERSEILSPDESEITVWMSHGDHISSINNAIVLATTPSIPVAAFKTGDSKIFGVQFHPEVTHTEYGFELLKKFANEICGIEIGNFDMQGYLDRLIIRLREEIGDERVIIGVSGGVDSSVAALILHRAIGDRLHPIFIDHGMLRYKEADDVNRFFESLNFANFHFVDASDIFLSRLDGIRDPEEKRKIIGHTFIEMFEAEKNILEREFGEFKYLAQGTIFTDRVESGSVSAGTQKIKSHHNLTLPDNISMRIIEPLNELYKDEVRVLGKLLGLDEKFVNRYPFPGPGLAVRILGNITREKIRVLQLADNIFMEELMRDEVHYDVWQAFAVLLEGRAVGVQGDNRTYGNIIALRAVQSTDGMTADFSRLPWELLSKVSTRIINSIPEISRVVYDISTKPPATIEFE